ncbi:MAG: hypothetical protein C0507_23480 [Cyanobacteria bacterium PR.3.49]|nr:hypothetical protein [Cyanobacteria bacterium PR.3.49]
MAPLLQIALLLVCIVWVIPLTWAAIGGARALIRLFLATRSRFAGIINSKSEDTRHLYYAESLQKDEYQRLKDEVIRKRALIADAIDLKPLLQEEIYELQLQLQEFQLQDATPTAASRLKALSLSSTLASRQKQLDELAPKLASLQEELEIKGRELHAMVPKNQAMCFKPKEDKANKRIDHAAVAAAVEKKIQRIEFAVVKSQVMTSMRPVYYKSLTDYRKFADTVRRRPIEEFTLSDLRQTVKSLAALITEIEKTIPEMEVDEKLLVMHLTALEAEFELWKCKEREAKEEGSVEYLSIAQTKSNEFKLSISKYKPLLAELRNQLSDLCTFKLQFSRLKTKLLGRITEIECMDFSPTG